MRLLGDVPEEHKKLSEDLQSMEKDIATLPTRNTRMLAQLHVCLAHDWLQIGMEEETHRLLQKAETICPGYFKNFMVLDTQTNPDFDKLVKNLSIELTHLLLSQKKGF